MTKTFQAYHEQLLDFIRVHSSNGDSGPGRAPSTDSEGEFNRLALELFSLQFRHVEPYHRFCQGRRVEPRMVDHWTQIPAISTHAFKETELTRLSPDRRSRVFHSSGTTGQKPSRHFHDAESLAIYEMSLLPWFQRHLLYQVQRTPRFVILTPPPALAPHSSLVHMFGTVCREFGSASSLFSGRTDLTDTWIIDRRTTLATLRKSIEVNEPVVLLGTAFSFVHFLDHLNECLQMPLGSRVMETGGYKGRSRALPKNELHSSITRALGVPATQIVCEYGMTELSSQAYDHIACHDAPAARRAFSFPPWARAQIVSVETGREVPIGETGLIRVFDLANVHSVMAVQTADLAVRRGDEFELIGRTALVEPRGCSLMAK